MSPNAIYSKSGKGVQEASGKTSQLARADRAVLSAIDGKMTLAEVADKVGKPFDAKFEELIGKLDRDGFVRQVSAGAPVATPGRPGAAKPAAAAAPKAGGGAPGEDLDFTIAMPAPKAAPPKPAAPPPAPPVAPHMAQSNAAAFARAREEAEEKAAKERDRIKAEAEAKMRAEMEAKARSEAELKAKSDAEARVRAEAEAKIKAARDAAVRAAAEAKAKAEAEAAAKLEAERARVREAEEKARREAEEAKRQAEEAKRKAEEEARKAREEAERIRKEAEEAKRQAEEARRKAEEEARRIREEAERKAKEEAERRRKEEEARRAREEQERKEREAREKQERERAAREKEAREQAEREAREREESAEKERRARERAEREAREQEEEAREIREKAERKAREKAEREQREREEEERAAAERAARKARDREKEKEKAAAKPESFGDSLLADLDSFSQRDDEERKEKEEAAGREKEAARRRQDEADRQAKEQAERDAKEKARAEEERRRRDEEERRAKEEERREAERREQEEKERARKEEKERKRRAKEEAKPAADDDIPLSDDDLDMDEVKKDEAILSKESRRAAREREERERQAKKDAKRDAKRAAREDKEEKREARREPAPAPQFRRPRKWGKMVSTTLFLALIAGVGVLHVMPISTAEYEAAASAAVGRPVKIPSARLSLYSGVQLKFDGVSVGDAKIATVRAFPEIGSLFGPQKVFSRIELEGVTVPQAAVGGLFSARVKGDNFAVGRVSAKQVKLAGPLQFPPLEIDLAIAPDGSVTSTSLRGPDGLAGKLTPKGADELEFDVVAHSFTVPVVPDMSLSGFAMKGIATRDGMKIESWGGSSLDGAVSGSATVRWGGGSWAMDGVMTVRGINAAVFAPALLSEGKAEGTGRFSFHDPDPMAFLGRGRIEGTFSVHKGVLGSFDLSRAIQTGGRQAAGRTPFTGLSGQGVFDKGAVALRNVSFGAGALNAGASADIAADGNLSGRIVADVRTPSQTLRATLNLGGTVRDPQVRN